MEEQQERRNAGEKEGRQPSRNSGETGPEPKEHMIDIVEINPTVKNWNRLVQKAKERIQSQSQWPRIPKVRQMLRGTQDFNKFYEPKVISLGPYHHGKPHLRPGEMIKPLCALKFVADSKQDIEALYTKIESNIEAVRKCYDTRPTNRYNDEALTWMMLLDGLFLLQFIRSRVDPALTVDMSNVLRNHQINFVVQDLFLVENQLPFGVLKLIFEGTRLPGEEMIKKFVTNTGRPEGSTSKIPLKEENKEPSHLLDLLRSALLGRYKKIQPKQDQKPEEKEKSSLCGGGDGEFCCPWKKGKQQGKGIGLSKIKEKASLCAGPDYKEFLSLIKGKQQGIGYPWKNGKQRGIWKSFRRIKELKAAGIYFKPSRTSSLTDISFKSYFFYGHLKLPPIIIDDFTKSRFLNMIAYEMCPDAPDDYAVTSYICFLNELIDHPDDVKELRSKHILYNLLGSDEDVAQLFNEIANDVVDTQVYKDVKARIQEHYNKRVNTWIAQVLHDHFRSPWTFMALTAAVWILILTGLQTYYAHPGKHITHTYMWLFGVPSFLFVVRYIVRPLWD